jgi:hypothetical protein
VAQKPISRTLLEFIPVLGNAIAYVMDHRENKKVNVEIAPEERKMMLPTLKSVMETQPTAENQRIYAKLLLQGNPTPTEKTEALAILTAAATEGDRVSAFVLGDYWLHELEMGSPHHKADEYINAQLNFRLALDGKESVDFLPKNERTAALVSLSDFKTYERDYPASVELLEKALEDEKLDEDMRGQLLLKLGRRHEFLPLEKNKSIEIYKLGAQTGNVDCMIHLSTSYLFHGSPEVLKNAESWLLRAFKKGNDFQKNQAATKLVELYLENFTNKGNKALEFREYIASDSKEMCSLGYHFLYKQNFSKAYQWFSRARELGNTEAKKNIENFSQLRQIDLRVAAAAS